ncbi:uncharacterized protein PITG_14819 [Phytophthora infestans T30-4]|uniref:Uncharacterized protein n=1 Tax=Phytophthora infestans (strain T30-4) TaxID=403677 RepID=D0NP44_PHYIT|nr:uncharacterized protein PITG_14819 [Phytophthora infestans T30-4]EEY62386.1 hypothetical protein PITG_14819 [Phytophthora infestans T30-4]|eukprot:XP_002899022.1 hypothetical protein PITG_14819 [Phytophthora infestans T30-4]
MGGADFHAFADAFGSPIPFCQAVLRGPGFASSGESWSESLEEFVAGGIVAASRHNGFAGLKNSDFERFLSAVMYELGLKAERHIRHQFPEVLEQALSQLSLSVPTLLPLDMELPQLLRTSQLKFGTLKRVQTENPGFGFIDGKVFVECASNRDEDEEFVKTVGHAPPDSIVHIIIVGDIRESSRSTEKPSAVLRADFRARVADNETKVEGAVIIPPSSLTGKGDEAVLPAASFPGVLGRRIDRNAASTVGEHFYRVINRWGGSEHISAIKNTKWWHLLGLISAHPKHPYMTYGAVGNNKISRNTAKLSTPKETRLLLIAVDYDFGFSCALRLRTSQLAYQAVHTRILEARFDCSVKTVIRHGARTNSSLFQLGNNIADRVDSGCFDFGHCPIESESNNRADTWLQWVGMYMSGITRAIATLIVLHMSETGSVGIKSRVAQYSTILSLKCHEPGDEVFCCESCKFKRHEVPIDVEEDELGAEAV